MAARVPPPAGPRRRAAPAGELWAGLHLALLRLPDQAARAHRDRLAAEFGPVPAGRAGAAAAWPADGTLVPPLPAAGHAGLVLRAGPGAGRWRSARAAELAGILEAVLQAAEAGPGIHHALEEMADGAQIPLRLDPDTLHRYRERAWARLRELDKVESGGETELRYLVWADEAVCSIFPLPLPHPESWWGRCYAASRRLVRAAAAACGEATVEVLDGQAYDRDVRARVGGSPVVLPVDGPRVDRVLWTLRMPYRLREVQEPGRVIHGVLRHRTSAGPARA